MVQELLSLQIWVRCLIWHEHVSLLTSCLTSWIFLLSSSKANRIAYENSLYPQQEGKLYAWQANRQQAIACGFIASNSKLLLNALIKATTSKRSNQLYCLLFERKRTRRTTLNASNSKLLQDYFDCWKLWIKATTSWPIKPSLLSALITASNDLRLCFD